MKLMTLPVSEDNQSEAVHDGYGTHYWSSRLGWVFVHRLGESKSIYAHLQEPNHPGYYNEGDVIGSLWKFLVHFEHRTSCPLIEHNQPYRF